MEVMGRKKEWTNQEVAELLRAVAAAYTVKEEDKFKIAAYEEAAAGVEHASSLVQDLWETGKLDEIPGVGKAIASHLDELFRTGRVKHFGVVMKGLPPAMFEFLPIRGVGPKTAYKLAKALGIKERRKAIPRLIRAAQEGKIAGVSGFGEEVQRGVLAAVKRRGEKKGRMLLWKADELAEGVICYLKMEKAVKRADPLGSLRRRVATVGDVDVAVATDEPEKVMEHFLKWGEIRKKLAAGENTARVILRTGQQIDVKIVKEEEYGALLQHYTGSKQHNIHLRSLAVEKGLSLSEYGIKRKGKMNRFGTEEGFYKFLGMDWIPPELREDTGEIEAVMKGKLPKLVEEKDIKGDLHIHSNFKIETSHDEGTSPIEELMRRAEELGYEYIGLTEHNPSRSQHSEKQIVEILKRKKAKVEQINSSWKQIVKKRVTIFNGLEVDIRPKGELATGEAGLELLDFVIVSVHSSFGLARTEMTKRVLAALAHPKVRILGHPTGRMLGKREEMELDWDKVMDYCKRHDKWLEINAWPGRLDLPDVLVREAVKNGVKLIINTDSHVVDQMDFMGYGVSVARRGWASFNDILNTKSASEFGKLLH